MPNLLRYLTSLGAITLGSSLFAPSDAHACGGCFHAETDPEVTVVTGHRMAFAISPTQTVLWDQVQYAGSPSEFAWVLPIKPGARLELASDAWFQALDAATTARIVAPQLNCITNFGGDEGDYSYGSAGNANNGCCGSPFGTRIYASDSAGAFDTGSAGSSSGEPPPPPPPVSVIKEETVGPYAVVTLHANIPNVLADWLIMNGFAVDPAVQPIIDQYTNEGFDFIAMHLKPDATVRSMKPVRVVSPGASPTLPLRMVSAGTGAMTAITLYIVGEGRWEAENFPNGALGGSELTWNFSTGQSDYADRRAELLAKELGRTWATVFAEPQALLKPLTDNTGNPAQFAVPGGSSTYTTIAQLFAGAAYSNNETSNEACANTFLQYGSSNLLVVDPCDHGGGLGDGSGGGGGSMGSGGAGGAGGAGAPNCGTVNAGELDAREFICPGPDVFPGEDAAPSLDDLAVALTGMHPSSVWVTRLEANLPHDALTLDFSLKAESTQAQMNNWIQAQQKLNVPCSEATLPPLRYDNRLFPPNEAWRREILSLTVGFAALLLAFARRMKRPLVPVHSR